MPMSYVDFCSPLYPQNSQNEGTNFLAYQNGPIRSTARSFTSPIAADGAIYSHKENKKQ